MAADKNSGDALLISRLQENLGPIRKVANMTTSDLAEEIGVSRQTISSLENQRSKMTKTQYLALRSVFNFKAAENQALAQVIKALVDDPIDGEEQNQHQEDVARRKAITTAMAGASATTALLAGMLPLSASIAAALSLLKKQ